MKLVYLFGPNITDNVKNNANILGGKGANLRAFYSTLPTDEDRDDFSKKVMNCKL